MKRQNAYEVFAQKTEEWINLFISHLPNIVFGVIVFILFLFAAKIVRKVGQKFINRITNNASIINMLAMFSSRVMTFIGFFIFLKILGLETAISSLLAGAGIVGLALGFAFQDLTANFISGIFIVAGEPIRVGDMVETNDYTGHVVEIRIRSTIIQNFSGQLVELPSRKIIENPIVNYTKLGMRRIQIDCSVSYDDDLDKVEEVTWQAIQSLNLHIPEKPIEVHFTKFADSSISLLIWLWINLADKSHPGMAVTTSKCIKAIKSAYNANGVTIPFPTAVEIQR